MKKSLWRALKFWPNARQKVSQNADIVIAVMGVTGAGKSSFVATVTGQKDIRVGHDLYSGKSFHESMNVRELI
jgi:ABC-type branched-subunit amino acid transport system ATPase component